MIITNIGADKSRGDDQLTITSVVLSDFDFSNYGKNDVKQVIAIKGDNLQSVVPTVGLLSNGNAIVQTDVDTSFRPRSAFIFANNGRADFLLAIEEHLLGNLNATVSIDALHKVRFDAIANDIVTKDELKSLVTSEFNAIPKDDAPSYASDAYSRATNYADSQLTFKANVSDLIPFAKQSDVNNQLASKANDSDLSAYAKQSSVDYALNNKADTSSLSQFAIQSSVNSAFNNKADIATLSSYATNASVQSQLAIKADASQLSSYVTSVDANRTNTSIDAQLASKANLYVLSDYAKSSDVNAKLASKVDTSVLSAYVTTQVLTDASSQVDSALQTKANIDDLSNYATSSAITALSSEVGNQLLSKADNVSLTSLATSLVNSANGSFNAVQQQASTHFQFHGVYKDGILSLANQDDGAYELYGNAVDGPNNFYGYGIALKYHNTWNTLIMLYDNATSIWTNRQGPGGWTGWKQIVTTDMLSTITPDASTIGKVDPSTIFRGYIDADEYTLKDVTRPDGIYKVSTWIKQPKCADLPTDFYSGLGYTIQKTTIDDHYGTIHVVGTKNQFTLSWIGWGTNWAGWMQSNVT